MKPQVLIVDDSLTVRMDLAEAFVAAGFECALCSSAGEARQALSQRMFGIMILDIVLPDADGIDFLREIKSSSATAAVPVLLLSSETEIQDRVRGLTTGADDYVGKPYNLDYVVARAQDLLGLRGQEGPPSEASKVLIIDDSETFRRALQEELEAAGYGVMTASSGEEGLRAAFAFRPSAVIVDGILPGIDGGTVIRKIRADTLLRRTPTLLLTASEDRTGELKALDAGADAYVRKEEDMSIITARLKAMLRSAGSPPEISTTANLLGPKKILAVDDSLTYLHEIAPHLRQDGYDVIFAQSGEEALELLSVQTVDCILLDLVMPGLSGKETCLRIKGSRKWRDIPLILHTAREEQDGMIEGINAGADDYISKSSEIEVLKARLHAQLRRKQFEDENRAIREQLVQKEREATESRSARELAETRAALLADLQKTNIELLRAKSELEDRNQRVQEANRLKSEFLANMSHELRTPLNAIIGFAELMHDGKVGSVTEQQKEYLGDILTSGRHLLTLINDVLDLSKVEAGKMDFRPEKTNLAVVVREITDIVRELAAKKRILIETDIDASLTELFLDPAKLKQVLYNYLSNAIKFTGAEGRVTVRARPEEEGKFRVEVEDTGIGIEPKDLDRLFVEFQQLDSSSEKQYPGTGLGLALTKKIVVAQGGHVGVRSVPGQGSIFFMVLPCRP
ncbi:response regulator [Oligoflexus tunisiensis]|uniref:response regulator n=1 Tax=Oligoflexus tunisiensis TaxID=708132 RepID=UPI000A4EBE88|nr:response regulator [Oligoflexus tunisiensis]